MSFAQHAQPPAAATSNEKPAANAPPATPAPIPLPELAGQAEATSANLHEIEAALAADDSVATVTAELPALTREIDARQRENARIVAQRPSLDLLRSLEQGWLSAARDAGIVDGGTRRSRPSGSTRSLRASPTMSRSGARR